VLTYTAASTSDPWRGAAYLAAYGLGLVAPLLLLSLFADAARVVVQRVSRWLPVLEKVSGGLMLAAGTYLMLGVASPPPATVTPTDAPRAAVTVDPPLGTPSARPRMVQFTSPDCSICRQMIPTVGVIERDCDGRQVDVVKVNVTEPQNRRLASRYRVRGVPTFVFFDRNGAEVARLVGYQTLGSLRQSLSALVGERCAGLGPFVPEAGRCEGSGATCGG
jgi:cytochrome c-type biogenesis protein